MHLLDPPTGVNKFDMRATVISIERALEFVGDNLWFQKRTLIICALQWIIFSMLTMGNPFFFQPLSFLCYQEQSISNNENNRNLQQQQQINQTNENSNQNNFSYSYVSCSESDYCLHPDINKIDESHQARSLSAVHSFQLYCSRKNYISLAESVFFFGSTMAVFIFPRMADKLGRKLTIIYVLLLQTVAALLFGLSFNVYILVLGNGLIGMAFNAFEIICFVYFSEISTSRFRNFSTVALEFAWIVGQFVFSILTTYVREWRYLVVLGTALPNIVLLLLAMHFLAESPRFLVSLGKYKLAKQVLNVIAYCNHRPRFLYTLEGEHILKDGTGTKFVKYNKLQQQQQDQQSNVAYQQALQSQQTAQEDKEDEIFQDIGFIQLMKSHPKLLPMTLLMACLWFYRFFMYFGFIFSVNSYGAGFSNLRGIFLVLTSTELVGCVLAAYIKYRYQVRLTQMGIYAFLTVIAAASLAFAQIPVECMAVQHSCYQKYLDFIMTAIAKLAVTIFNGVLLIYTLEVFPTQARSLCFGFCISFGKFGSIAIPFIVTYFQGKNINPLMLFSLLGIIVLIILRFLPETYGKIISDPKKQNKIKTNARQINKSNISTNDNHQESYIELTHILNTAPKIQES